MAKINMIADILTLASYVVDNIRRQNYSDAGIGQKQIINKFAQLLGLMSDDVIEQVKGVLIELMDAQERKDYVLFADVLELQMTPVLLDYQLFLLEEKEIEFDDNVFDSNIKLLEVNNFELARLVKEDRQWLGELSVEYSSSGYFTLKVTSNEGELYFHSNVNPRIEGKILAEEYYDVDIDEYIVYGLSLGYHINALLDIDDGISIDIIEPRLDVICAAMHCMDMSRLLTNERVTITYDPGYSKMSKIINDRKKMVIHYPTMRSIRDDKIRLSLQKYFIHESGVRKYLVKFKNNFRENIKNVNGYVDELRPLFAGKNAVLVAAGPSLDKNVHLLKKVSEGVLIVAVGTVYHKLIKLGIEPDYVVVLDSQESTAKQFEDLYDMNVPVLIASTAVKEVGMKYKGMKYLVCQRGYNKAEQYALEHNYTLYDTGGSVSTIMLDICLRLGCKEIAYIGLDLAYTNDRTHSKDTNDVCEIDDEDNIIKVEAIDGSMVNASRVFVIYREWMERRAKHEDAKGKLIDATEGGALIDGFRIENLASVLNRFSME